MSGAPDPWLRELQALFLRAVRHPTGVADFVASVDAHTRAALESAFVDGGDLGVVARLDVYAESYFWRLHDVLAEQYAVTAWLIGDARFRNLATDFVLEHPPRGWDLHRFGDPFVPFLAEHGITAEFAAVDRLAAVERAIAHALHARDQTPLTPRSMARVPPTRWPALRFELAATVSVLAGPWPYPRLCEARRAGEPPGAVDRAPLPTDAHTLVWRRDGTVFHRAIEADEAAALDVLSSGGTFESLCERAVQSAAASDSRSVLDRVVERLQTWFARGLIVGVDTEPRRGTIP